MKVKIETTVDTDGLDSFESFEHFVEAVGQVFAAVFQRPVEDMMRHVATQEPESEGEGRTNWRATERMLDQDVKISQQMESNFEMARVV